MRYVRFSSLLWLFPLTVFVAVFFFALNYTYPLIGHDYLFFLPKLLAGKWHFVRQGFSPFRFIPHFCGGLPMYGNPQEMYYSLPQLLTLILDPWWAIQLSVGAALLLGYAGWYRFGRDVLLLETSWAHPLALVILANGFSLLHMIVGHLTFHTVPLLGFLLWILFDRRRTDTTHLLALRAGGFALLSAYTLYAGYPLVLLFTVLASLSFLPLDLLFSEHPLMRLRTLSIRAILCGGAALLVGASKLTAIYSFMRFFPRHVPFNTFPEGASTLLFIARAFWYIPQGRFLFAPASVPWGVQEYSMFLSPATLMGLLCGAPLLFQKRGGLLQQWKRTLLALVILSGITLFFVQLTRGYGPLAGFLGALPFFRSLHVTTRFLYVFSLFVSIGGVLCIRSSLRVWRAERWEKLCIHFIAFLTVVGLPLAYLPLLRSQELLSVLDYRSVQEALRGNTFLLRPVTDVSDGKLDLQHVLDGTTAIHCFEPLFGYHREWQETSLVEGPVGMEYDHAFNLQNPACFVYPEENRCHPGDRISLSDRENFERFRQGLPTTWKLSRIQRWSDGVSVLTLILTTLFLFLALVRTMRAPRQKIF